MEHTYYQDLLSAYFDGEFRPEEERMLDEHLATCAECRAMLERMKRLTEFADEHSELGEAEYWERSAQRIEQAIDADQTEVTDIKPSARSAWTGLGWKLPAIAAAIALLTFVGLHQSDISQEDEFAVPSQSPSIVKPDRQSADLEVADEADESAETKEEPVGRRLQQSVVAEEESQRDETSGLAERVRQDLQELGDVTSVDADAISIPANEIGADRVARSKVKIVSEGLTTVAAPNPAKSPPAAVPAPVEPVTIDSDKSIDQTIRVSGKKDVLLKSLVAGESNYVADTPASRQKEARDAPTKVSEIDKDSNYKVVTNAAGSVFVRGGRAGEVDYVIDTRPIDEPPSNLGESTTGFGATNDSLSYWRALRDSLTTLAKSTSPTKANKPGRRQSKKSSVQQNIGLVDAWYWICRLSRDSSEVQRGKDYLRSVAADSLSPRKNIAQRYLKALDRE